MKISSFWIFNLF